MKLGPDLHTGKDSLIFALLNIREAEWEDVEATKHIVFESAP
jgi:hypothetical protein